MKVDYITKSNNTELKVAIVFLNIPVFVFSPLLAVIAQAVLLFSANTRSKILYYSYFLYLSLMLGIINSTKIPASDMINYLHLYREIARYNNIFDYLSSIGTEPVYYVFSYLIHVLVSGSEKIFIILFTSIIYYLPLCAIYEMATKLRLNNLALHGVLIFFSFFPPLFSISFHLNRQVLAGSLLMVLFIRGMLKEKESSMLLIAIFLTHSSGLIFFLIKPIKRFLGSKINNTRILFAIIASVIMFSLLSTIGAILQSSGIDALAYAGERASQKTYHQLDKLSFSAFLILFISFISVAFNAANINRLAKVISKEIFNTYSYIYIFIIVFVIVASFNPSTNELANRFLFYIYFLLPITVLLNLYLFKYSSVLYLLILVVFPVFFYLNIENGIWVYQEYMTSIVLPLVINI